MSTSSRFELLQNQLEHLREWLLPIDFDPTGNYSQEVITKAIAYRVLVHAEIESYLEDIVRQVAEHALREWKNRNSSGRVLLALLAFSGLTMEEPPPSINAPQQNQQKNWRYKVDLDEKINHAAKSFRYSVDKNHGVKEENIWRLLLPIGFPSDKLDQTWLNDMNSFGHKRGEAAHCSLVKTMPNPQDELLTINHLLNGLKDVDMVLKKIIE